MLSVCWDDTARYLDAKEKIKGGDISKIIKRIDSGKYTYSMTEDRYTSGNGRMVRNFFEKIIATQASRVANMRPNISLQDMLLITKEDILLIRKDEWDDEDDGPRKIGF